MQGGYCDVKECDCGGYGGDGAAERLGFSDEGVLAGRNEVQRGEREDDGGERCYCRTRLGMRDNSSDQLACRRSMQ